MARPQKVSDEKFLKAIEATGGVKAEIARMLGLTRAGVHKRIDSDPKLAAACDEARETLVDDAETGLRKKISQQEIKAIVFVLTTLGRNRGYGKSLELSGSLETTGVVHILKLPDNGRDGKHGASSSNN